MNRKIEDALKEIELGSSTLSKKKLPGISG